MCIYIYIYTYIYTTYLQPRPRSSPAVARHPPSLPSNRQTCSSPGPRGRSEAAAVRRCERKKEEIIRFVFFKVSPF